MRPYFQFGRRGMPELFGASLLDMMTCTLGAMMLLMILKQTQSDDDILRIQRDIGFLTESVATHNASAADAEAWLEEARETARRRASGTIFGLPPLVGDVVFVVDTSNSMVEYGSGKMDRVRVLLTTAAVNSPGIEYAAALVFNETVKQAAPWTRLESPEARSGLVARVRDRLQIGPYTDLLGAVREALRLLAERPSGGTVILFSDGLHFTKDGRQYALEDFASMVRDETEVLKRQGKAVLLHCIGLFDYSAPHVRPPEAQALRYLFSVLEARSTDVPYKKDAVSAANRQFGKAGSLEGAVNSLLFKGFTQAEIDAAIRPRPDRDLGVLLRAISEENGGVFIAIPVDPYAAAL